MYKIEFNSDTTLEGLLESFKNLKECGIEGYVEIDEIKIYGSDSKLEEKLTELFQTRKKDRITEPIISEKKEKGKNNQTSQELNYSWNLSNLSQNEVFKYYLGLSLKYIKQEYREKLKKYYIDVYCNDRYENIRDIHLLANILLILEYKDVLTIQEKLNLFFLNISKKDVEKLNLVLITIENYATNGALIKQYFYRDILEEDIKNIQKSIF